MAETKTAAPKKAATPKAAPKAAAAKPAAAEAVTTEAAAPVTVVETTAVAPVEPETTGTTTLDSDVTKPSVTAPGDGPADTTDPTEIASTVTPNPGPEAFAAGTVNSVVKVGQIGAKAAERDSSEDRFEEYDAVKPSGEVVRVRRNIETGVSEIVSK